MATSLHTFIDIFETSFDVDGESVQLKSITIPAIQRDYAQGRRDPEIERVRNRFLNSLFDAIANEAITLDFVYGDIDETGCMTPLDGQQRLTTLFLLHWYAAKKECVSAEEWAFLSHFSYKTRYSARDFCSFLVRFDPTFAGPVSEEIIDQTWFPLDWKKDPTIASMLVMLDAIQEKFAGLSGIWSRLKEGAITFYFLPIKDMGLTDELYIKMNSRGKPLTQFEHFKAELEQELKRVDGDAAKRILRKIDQDWTDMLWQYRGDDHVTDDEFLRYFKFVCDVICYHAGGTPQGRSNDEFFLLDEYFTAGTEKVEENIATLEDYFDCWHRLCKEESPLSFFGRIFSFEHEAGKVQIDGRYELDIFADCLKNYADSTGRRRVFPLNRIVLLYAIVAYLLRKDYTNAEEFITEEEFIRRLRIVNNLVQNSEDEISDSTARTSGNRMPAILAQVDKIIIDGAVDPAIEKNFNPSQLAEEIEKGEWLKTNHEKADRLYAFEDHKLLYGQISIIGLEHFDLFDRFTELFTCDLDKVDCALMAIGFYPQRERNNWRYQFGSSSTTNEMPWRNLFHKSSNNGFEETRRILIELLSKGNSITNEFLDAVREAYIAECEAENQFTWRYYYVKYPVFRPGSYGKYSLSRDETSPYLFSVMQTQTQWSSNTYIPYLKEVDEPHLSRDDCGQYLDYGDTYLGCEADAFILYSTKDEAEIERIEVQQNPEGIDTENRILLLQNYLKSKGLIT